MMSEHDYDCLTQVTLAKVDVIEDALWRLVGQLNIESPQQTNWLYVFTQLQHVSGTARELMMTLQATKFADEHPDNQDDQPQWPGHDPDK